MFNFRFTRWLLYLVFGLAFLALALWYRDAYARRATVAGEHIALKEMLYDVLEKQELIADLETKLGGLGFVEQKQIVCIRAAMRGIADIGQFPVDDGKYIVLSNQIDADGERACFYVPEGEHHFGLRLSASVRRKDKTKGGARVSSGQYAVPLICKCQLAPKTVYRFDIHFENNLSGGAVRCRLFNASGELLLDKAYGIPERTIEECSRHQAASFAEPGQLDIFLRRRTVGSSQRYAIAKTPDGEFRLNTRFAIAGKNVRPFVAPNDFEPLFLKRFGKTRITLGDSIEFVGPSGKIYPNPEHVKKSILDFEY